MMTMGDAAVLIVGFVVVLFLVEAIVTGIEYFYHGKR